MMDILMDDVKDFLCNTGFGRLEEVIGIEFDVGCMISVSIKHDKECGLYRLKSKINRPEHNYTYICGVTDKMKDCCVIDILVDAIRTCYSDAWEYYRNHPEHTPCHDQVSLADLNHGYLSTQAIPNAEKYGTFEFCIALNNRSDVKCKIVYNQSNAYSLRLADYDTEFDKIIDISVSSKYSLLTIENLFMFLIERYFFRDYGSVKLSFGSDHAYCKCSTNEDKPDYEQKYWDCQRRIDEYERNLNGYKGQIEKKSKIIQNLLHTNAVLTDANEELKRRMNVIDKDYNNIIAENDKLNDIRKNYDACLERIDELQKENDNLRKANERLKKENSRFCTLTKDILNAATDLYDFTYNIDKSPYERLMVVSSQLISIRDRINRHIYRTEYED